MGWYEKNWSAVKLKNVAYPMAGVSTNSSVSWYDKLIEMSKERSLKLEKYNAMDLTVDISRALDIIAEDISSDGADDNETFKLEAPEHVRITAANIKSSESVLRLWKDKTEFEYKFFDYIRETLKYGLVIFEKNKDGTLKKLIAKRIEGYKLDSDDDNKVTHYIYDDAGEYINMNGDTIAPSKQKSVKQKREIPVEDLLILKVGESPLGDSILDRIYRPWKQLQLLEDAIIIYRIVRAPERRIFYIDIGNMPSSKAQTYIEGIKNKMRQKQINKDGVLETEYNPASMQEDYFLGQCLSLDTKISLINGEEITLVDVIDRYENNEDMFVYSVNRETKATNIGKIGWAGVTRKNAELVKLTFDNGETLTCTPDHKIVTRDGSYVEAQYLNDGDSLMPLYRKRVKTNKTQKENKYELYQDMSDGKWKFTHLLSCPKKEKDTVIHHIDCNSFNNYPANLIEMNKKEHIELHKSLGSYHMINAWGDEEKRKNLIDGMHRYWEELSPEDREIRAVVSRENLKKISPMTKEQHELRVKVSRIRLNELRQDEEWIEKFKKSCVKAQNQPEILEANRQRRIDYNKRTKTYHINESMFIRFCETVGKDKPNLKQAGITLFNDREFMELFDNCNHRKAKTAFGEKFIRKIAVYGDYDDYNDFKHNYQYNHKVISVEFLDYKEDTGCLTIEDAGDNHNFAISAGIFVKNSGDGRGSKVETLSGGDNLGQIEDLQFFNKKLSLGLRIPPSYLDSYSEDINGATQNDGRLGTAYIAELRYVGYVKRLQKKIARALSEHFRNFAGKQDVEINEDLIFMIEPPQSFAIYKQNELDSVTLNAYGSAEGVDSMSKRFAMKRYLQLEEDEIVMNEELKLQELGLDEKILKKLPDYIRYNFIYGDGEAARSYVENELVKAGIDVKPAPNLEQGGME